jgi:hypothetical protein
VSLRAHGTLKGFEPRVEEWLKGGAVPGFALDVEAALFDALHPDMGPECTRRIPRAFGVAALRAKGATWTGVESMEENALSSLQASSLALYLRASVFGFQSERPGCEEAPSILE